MADDPWDVVDHAPSQNAGVEPAAAPNADEWGTVSTQSPTASRSMASDVAQGAGRGLVSGASSLVGMPADVANWVDRASRWIVAKGAEKAGIVSPEHAQRFIDQDNELHRYLGSEGIEHGAVSAINAAGVPLDHAQTLPGKYAETVASFLPSAAAMPGSLPGNVVKYGILSGLTSEAAGQATKGTSVEPWARVAGAASPLLPGLVKSASGHLNPMRSTLTDLTPQQTTQAQALLDRSRAVGVPLTVPEAIQHVTGSATGLGDVQRVVEQSPHGGAIMKPFFSERPAQVEGYGRRMFDNISPTTADPYELAPRVQGIGEGAVQAARNETNAISQPAYNATANNPHALISSAALDAIKQQPALERALTAVRADPVRYGDLRGMPDNAMPVLDAAKKYLDDFVESAKRSGENFAAANAGKASGDLLSIMDSEFPRYASARNIQAIRQRYVEEPLSRSPLGQLAGAETFPAQAKILFATNPLPGSEGSVRAAVAQVAKADPGAAQQMVRAHLEGAFNEATQANATGPNQFGAPKFTSVIAGNSQQAKNLQAAVTSLPNGGDRWKALRKGLDIFDAMGTRHHAGSMTDFNRQMRDGLAIGGASPEIIAAAASPAKWATFANDLKNRIIYARQTGVLARVFTEGDVQDLRALSGLGATKTLKAQAALAAILSREGALTGTKSEN